MFQWDKSITSLDIPVGKVRHLFRSMRDVQLALPGLPAQEATAYLCQYLTAKGVGTVAVFHLHKSSRLAYYVNAPLEVAAEKADAVLDQTQAFVESMGFLMTDLDIHLLEGADREMLWSSLPLQGGVQAAVPEQPAKPSPAPAPAKPKGGESPGRTLARSVLADLDKVAAPDLAAPAATAPAPVPAVPGPPSDAAGEPSPGDVDDLLAAVEALRTRRPGVRARKKMPGADELRRRRQELRENLGRILASH